MRVIKGRSVVEDAWIRVADEEPVPDGDIIVSWKRWCAEREALLAHRGRLGVAVDGMVALPDLARDREHFALIALEFPKFGDGRCYSHANMLRMRHGYTGELRAVGDVLRDQLFFMARCGIDSFAVREDKDIDAALSAFDDFSVKYQAAADGALPVYRLR